MKIFFFIQKRKIKHSIVTVYFYFEEERKKELFIAVNSNVKRYYTISTSEKEK
jgi:hypothetical protein